MLEKDSPESLVILALQCVDDEQSNRPTGGDVLDWVQDLLGDLDDDIINPPKLKHVEHLMNSITFEFSDFSNPSMENKEENNPVNNPYASPDRSQIILKNQIGQNIQNIQIGQNIQNGQNGNGNGHISRESSKNGFVSQINPLLSLNPKQLNRVRNGGIGSEQSSPATSSCYNSCASTPRNSTQNTKEITPPRPRSMTPKSIRTPPKIVKENKENMVFSSPDVPKKSIRSPKRDSMSTNGSMSPITPTDATYGKKKRTFNPIERLELGNILFDRKVPKGGESNPNPIIPNSSTKTDRDKIRGSNSKKSKNQEDSEDKNDESHFDDDEDDDAEALVLAELMNKVQEMRKSNISVSAKEKGEKGEKMDRGEKPDKDREKGDQDKGDPDLRERGREGREKDMDSSPVAFVTPTKSDEVDKSCLFVISTIRIVLSVLIFIMNNFIIVLILLLAIILL